MQVVIDTREKRPWIFPGATIAKLDTGDYSISDYTSIVAIERKSHDDLFHCLGTAKSRFISQLKRLSKLEHKVLIVESSPEAILMGHYHSGIPGLTALQTLLSLCSKYKVESIFAGARKGQIVAGAWLANVWKILHNGKA